MKYNNKICVCTFHNAVNFREIGGISTGPLYLHQHLSDYFETVDLISLRDTKNEDEMFSNVKVTSNPEILNEYDFVIFMSPGLTHEKFNENKADTAYMDVLNTLTKKFAFIINEEADRKLYPYYKNFLNHPNMALVIFNSIGMEDTFQDFLEVCPNWTRLNFAPKLEPLETILERARTKDNVITSTAVWKHRKRQRELIESSENFVKHGIQVKIAGSHHSTFYVRSLQKDNLLENPNCTLLGYYTPSELPEIVKDAKFHYNFVYLKRELKTRIMKPRIEIATLECFNQGCLPVICSNTTPEWVGEDSAIRVPKTRFDELPEILSSLTDEEVENRLRKFYELVKINIHDQYEEFCQDIASTIEKESAFNE